MSGRKAKLLPGQTVNILHTTFSCGKKFTTRESSRDVIVRLHRKLCAQCKINDENGSTIIHGHFNTYNMKSKNDQVNCEIQYEKMTGQKFCK